MFELFTIFGVRVKAEWTIFFLILLCHGSFTIFFALLLTIILHELGHALAVKSQKGFVESIVLQGFGGMTLWSGPLSPLQRVFVAAAGPLVNLTTALLLFILFSSMSMPTFFQGLFTWSLVLGLFNLLPMIPLDGGHIVEHFVAHKTNDQAARVTALKITRIAAVVVGLYAVFVGRVVVFGIGLDPLFLTIFCALFFFMAHRELGAIGPYVSTESSFWERLKNQREDKKQQRKQESDLAVRARVDQLLAKISKEGMNSLTKEEREFLNSASGRFKN